MRHGQRCCFVRCGAAPLTPEQTEFRGIYKELVETNTTLSADNCIGAVTAMAARLKSAGFPDADIHQIAPPDRPKKANLVAVLHGTDKKAKAVLLLAHIDVVEAKREDWVRDPFTLIEEDGYFYGRGTADDKAMAAIFVDAMMRYKKSRLPAAPRHQNRADVRRRDAVRLRRRRLPRAEPSRSDRRRTCAQRGRRRPPDRRRPTDLQRRAGRRKGLSGLPLRSHQSRRTFVAAASKTTRSTNSPPASRVCRHSSFRSSSTTQRVGSSTGCRRSKRARRPATCTPFCPRRPNPKRSRVCSRTPPTTRSSTRRALPRCSTAATRRTACRNAPART